MTESEPDSTDSDSEDAFDPPSDEEEEELDPEEEEEEEVDSDFLDEEDVQVKKSQAKRKSTGGGGTTSKKTKSNGTSRTKKGDHEPVEGYEDEDDEDHEIELEEGQEIAGRIYPAPKTGLGGSPVRCKRLRLTYSTARADLTEHIELLKELANTRKKRPRVVQIT